MKSDNPLKHFAIPLLLALVIYAVAYTGIEHRRTRKGPWELTFSQGPEKQPVLTINQATLGLTNVNLTFPDQVAAVSPLVHQSFSTPRPVPYDLPFGQCVFMDTTFLPGTLTLRVFGHEIELLPRTLIIDHQEHALARRRNHRPDTTAT